MKQRLRIQTSIIEVSESTRSLSTNLELWTSISFSVNIFRMASSSETNNILKILNMNATIFNEEECHYSCIWWYRYISWKSIQFCSGQSYITSLVTERSTCRKTRVIGTTSKILFPVPIGNEKVFPVGTKNFAKTQNQNLYAEEVKN